MKREHLHHLELWRDDATTPEGPWPWLLQRLGYSRTDTWATGCTWSLDDTYVVLESGTDHVHSRTDRLRSGMNHLALWAGSRQTLTTSPAKRSNTGGGCCSLICICTPVGPSTTPPSSKTTPDSRSSSWRRNSKRWPNDLTVIPRCARSARSSRDTGSSPQTCCRRLHSRTLHVTDDGGLRSDPSRVTVTPSIKVVATKPEISRRHPQELPVTRSGDRHHALFRF